MIDEPQEPGVVAMKLLKEYLAIVVAEGGRAAGYDNCGIARTAALFLGVVCRLMDVPKADLGLLIACTEQGWEYQEHLLALFNSPSAGRT